MLIANRLIGFLAGLLGAAGVAGAALAAHGGYGESLRTAADFALIHAALVLALGFRDRPALMLEGARLVLLLGALAFCGDLALRALAGRGMFPMAAPTGGILLIGGWLLAALAVLFQPKSS